MKCRYYSDGVCSLDSKKATKLNCKKTCEWYSIEKIIKELEAENERLRLKEFGQHLENCLLVRLD